MNKLPILFILLFCQSCFNKHRHYYAIDYPHIKLDTFSSKQMTQFGIAFNYYRKENQIPLLPDSFVLDRYGLDYAGWKNPLDDSIIPRYDNKLITWDSDDSLIGERNVFIGPQNQMLVIWFGRYEKTVPYHFANSIKGEKGDLTRNLADSVLRAWHLIDR